MWFKTYEELPKRVQYFVNTIKKEGYQDITNLEFPCKYFGEDSFGCLIWIDAEDVARGKMPFRELVKNSIEHGSIKNVFGITHLSIGVFYKNKQQFGQKFLPELKKRLKESPVGDDIHSVRFDVKNKKKTPQVFIILKPYGLVLNSRVLINKILEEFKIEKGYFNLQTRIS
jgi:hypothetical protein